MVNESKHLYVFGVPRINLKNDLKRLLQRSGTICRIENVSDEISKFGVKLEIFTDCFHVVFEKEEFARKAKRFNDARNFMGGILHISYAFERESIEETRAKLNKRKMEVRFRLKINQKDAVAQPEASQNKKKHSLEHGSEIVTQKRIFKKKAVKTTAIK